MRSQSDMYLMSCSICSRDGRFRLTLTLNHFVLPIFENAIDGGTSAFEKTGKGKVFEVLRTVHALFKTSARESNPLML